MPASHTLDGDPVTFDDTHAVADAGLTLGPRCRSLSGFRALFDAHVDLGGAVGHANVGHKAMTLIHSALADGDSIADADALRSGATEGCWVTGCWPPRRWVASCGASRGVTPASSMWCRPRRWPGRGRLARGQGDKAVTVDVDSSIWRPTG